MNEFKEFKLSSAHAFYAVLLAVGLSGAAWIRAENAVKPDNVENLSSPGTSAAEAQPPSI